MTDGETTAPAVIDAAHIEHQRAWSRATFGPEHLRGPLGPLAHIRKELEEIKESPYDLEEWIDVIILGLDGACRAGHEPQQIIDMIKTKQAKNEARTWPDWRNVPADQAIEHIEAGGITQAAEPCWYGKLADGGHAFEYGDGSPHWATQAEGEAFLAGAGAAGEGVVLTQEPSGCWHATCDGCGYMYDEDEYVTHWPNEADLRVAVREVDWHFVDDRLLCAECHLAEARDGD